MIELSVVAAAKAQAILVARSWVAAQVHDILLLAAKVHAILVVAAKVHATLVVRSAVAEADLSAVAAKVHAIQVALKSVAEVGEGDCPQRLDPWSCRYRCALMVLSAPVLSPPQLSMPAPVLSAFLIVLLLQGMPRCCPHSPRPPLSTKYNTVLSSKL